MIGIYGKYTVVVVLKYEKGSTIFNAFKIFQMDLILN